MKRFGIVGVLVVATLMLVPAASGAQSVMCDGMPATVIGSDADDTLSGTAGPDVIAGLGGHDIIKGRGGDDVICGGPGDDELFGQRGNDKLLGGSGNDILFGHGGDDYLHGQAGKDVMKGHTGDDRLYGGAGPDRLYGGAGSDAVFGQWGHDALHGNTGTDLIVGGPGSDTCKGGGGADGGVCESMRTIEHELMLWNTLGSDTEIANSVVGPDGVVFGSGVSYERGIRGRGFTTQYGKSGPDFGLWSGLLDTYGEAGTVEFWWQPARDFDETGAPDEVFVSAVWSAGRVPAPFQLLYRWRFDFGGFAVQVAGRPAFPGEYYYLTGRVAPFAAGDWVHVAFVWDMDGLGGHQPDRYGVYVDGVFYPLTDASYPNDPITAEMPEAADYRFTVGYYTADYNNQMNGVIDEVRVWDTAWPGFAR